MKQRPGPGPGALQERNGGGPAEPGPAGATRSPEDQQQARPLIPPMFRSVFMTSWLHNDTKDTRKSQELSKLLFKRHKTDVFTHKNVLKNDTYAGRPSPSQSPGLDFSPSQPLDHVAHTVF